MLQFKMKSKKTGGFLKDMPVSDERNDIGQFIFTVRGQKVILDSDLAHLYGVKTKALNQAVMRNKERFPADFIFRITAEEWLRLRSQIVTSNGRNGRPGATDGSGRGGRRLLPFAFTEHGSIMAASILNSNNAVKMSVFVVRAFVRMRLMISENLELARKLAELEKMLTARLDSHERAIVHVLEQILRMINRAARSHVILVPVFLDYWRLGFWPLRRV
jgi:hypothetical protein